MVGSLKEGLAIVHCDPHVEGAPWPYAPRVILKSLIQRAADAGFEPWVGAEVEYFLLTRKSKTTRDAEARITQLREQTRDRYTHTRTPR